MRGGLTVLYHFYCRDDLDNSTDCNGLENHAHVRVAWTGSVAAADMSIQDYNRTGGWIVRNVRENTPYIGGEGTDAFTLMLATGNYAIKLAAFPLRAASASLSRAAQNRR